MYRIDDATAATSMPTPETAGTEGFWTEGNPGAGVPATLERASWFNMVQEELRNVVLAGNLTPSKTAYTQLRDAIKAYVGAGRLLRTSVYIKTTGTQQVVIDGAAATTTGATSWTPLATATKFRVTVVGGGAAAGGTPATGTGQSSVAGGGAGGAICQSIYPSATLGASAQAITVGAGGAGVSGATGNGGGTSSFGSFMSATGGGAGLGGVASAGGYAIQPITSAPPSGGNIFNMQGAPGGGAVQTTYNAGLSGSGGNSPLTGAGGGSGGSPQGGGYSTPSGFGAGGGGVAVTQNTAAQAGPSGFSGCVIVEEYA